MLPRVRAGAQHGRFESMCASVGDITQSNSPLLRQPQWLGDRPAGACKCGPSSSTCVDAMESVSSHSCTYRSAVSDIKKIEKRLACGVQRGRRCRRSLALGAPVPGEKPCGRWKARGATPGRLAACRDAGPCRLSSPPGAGIVPCPHLRTARPCTL